MTETLNELFFLSSKAKVHSPVIFEGEKKVKPTIALETASREAFLLHPGSHPPVGSVGKSRCQGKQRFKIKIKKCLKNLNLKNLKSAPQL